MLALLGQVPVAYGLAVGLAIAAMQACRLLHPPAGADPIVVLATGAGWSFAVVPVLVGAVALVLAALLYHRLVFRGPYPPP